MAFTKRSDKVAFLNTSGASVSGTFARMTNFTEFSQSKNPKEYTRQYVDEEFERSDIVGYAPSISYSFDYDGENDVHSAIVAITDGEKTGEDAYVAIALVDVASGDALVRVYSVIPDTEGDSVEAYTYSGTLKAVGAASEATGTVSDDGASVTIA